MAWLSECQRANLKDMDWNLPKSNPVVKIHQQSTGSCGAYALMCDDVQIWIWCHVINHYFYITLPDYTKFAFVTVTIMVWVLKLILACYLYKSMPIWHTINHNKTQHSLITDLGMLPWWPLLGILSWYPIFKSRHCNSFEDQAPVNFIYGCLIFKWVAVTWLHDRVPG